ncbi:hypothetical protein JYK22_31355, partial [Nonomuraea sp. RK-328]|nr:hypothetical protein [Nonomuraea sp. RK-328]
MAGDRTGVLAAFQRYPGRVLMTGLPNMFASPLGGVFANKLVYGEWGDFTLQSMVGGFAAGAMRTGTISPFNVDQLGRAAIHPITTLSNYANSVGSHLTGAGTTTSATTGGGPNGPGPATAGDRSPTGGPGPAGPYLASAQLPAPQPVIPYQRLTSDPSNPPVLGTRADASQLRTPTGDQPRTPAGDQQRVAAGDQPGARRLVAPDQPTVAAQTDRNGTAPAPDRATPSTAQQQSAPDQRTNGQRNPDQTQVREPANAQDQRQAVPQAQTAQPHTQAQTAQPHTQAQTAQPQNTQPQATQQGPNQGQGTQQGPDHAEGTRNQAAQPQNQAQVAQPQTQPQAQTAPQNGQPQTQPQVQAAQPQNGQVQSQASPQADTVTTPAAHVQATQNGQAAQNGQVTPDARAAATATASADPAATNGTPSPGPFTTPGPVTRFRAGSRRRSDYTVVTARPVRRSQEGRSRFVVKRRPAGTPKMTVGEVRAQFLTHADPSDISGVRGWTWSAGDTTLVVHHTTLGDIHFRVEQPGRLMVRRHGLRLFRPLARTKVLAGTAEQPHALRPNRNVASDQLALLVVHEISDSLQVLQARQAGVHTQRRLLAPRTGGHDYCATSRQTEFRHLTRRLGEATSDTERADLQREIDLVLSELGRRGRGAPALGPDEDAVTGPRNAHPDAGAGLAELRSHLERHETSAATASAELRASLLDRASSLGQADVDLNAMSIRHYEAAVELSEQATAAIRNGDFATADALIAAARRRHATADAYEAARAAAVRARAAHEAAADLLAARPLVMTDLTKAVEEARQAYAGYRRAVRDAVPFSAPMPDPASGNLRSAVATRVAALTLPAIDLYTAATENSDAADRAFEQERAAREAGDTRAAEAAHASGVRHQRAAAAYGEAAASLHRARAVYQSLLDRIGVTDSEVAQAFQHAHTLERFALMTVDLTATAPDPAGPLADLRAARKGRAGAVAELRQALGRQVSALDLATADMREASAGWANEGQAAFDRAGDAMVRQDFAEARSWHAVSAESQQAAQAHHEARLLAHQASRAYQAAADVLPNLAAGETLDAGALAERLRTAEDAHRRYQEAVDALPSPELPSSAPEQPTAREYGELAERRAATRERIATLAQEAERLDQLATLHLQEGAKAIDNMEEANDQALEAAGQRDVEAGRRRAGAEAEAEAHAEASRRHFRIAQRYLAAAQAARDARHAH